MENFTPASLNEYLDAADEQWAIADEETYFLDTELQAIDEDYNDGMIDEAEAARLTKLAFAAFDRNNI